jgi:hypothetical protein
MKKFFARLLFLLLLCLAIFWVLDVGFTYVFKKGYYTKIQWLYNKQGEEYDYAIHGSSRAFTTLDIPMIDTATGKKGINISVDGSSIPDQLLMLKIFLHNKNSIKRLYLQIDPFSSDTEEIFDFAIPKFFPYLKEDIVFDHFKQFGYQWYAYRYVPFYRYAMYNTLWGPHEVLIDQFKILPRDFDQYGDFFYPNIDYKGPEKLRSLTFDLNGKYKFLNEIALLCRQKRIQLILFTAPVADININEEYHQNIVSFTRMMKSKGIPYYNYGDLYGNRAENFYNEIHLNRKGAIDFTNHAVPIFR